ncbi:MAG: BrnA antitoxin family protein [Terriglobales bacterium]
MGFHILIPLGLYRDEDVLDWLKGHGKGYQTRINRILRVVMEFSRRGPRTGEPGAPHSSGHKA